MIRGFMKFVTSGIWQPEHRDALLMVSLVFCPMIGALLGLLTGGTLAASVFQKHHLPALTGTTGAAWAALAWLGAAAVTWADQEIKRRDECLNAAEGATPPEENWGEAEDGRRETVEAESKICIFPRNDLPVCSVAVTGPSGRKYRAYADPERAPAWAIARARSMRDRADRRQREKLDTTRDALQRLDRELARTPEGRPEEPENRGPAGFDPAG